MQRPSPKGPATTAWKKGAAPDIAAEQSEIWRRVSACFRRTAAEQDRLLQPLRDDLLLLDSGLDSLCFAIVVAELEDQLGVDPFSDLDDAGFPVTFGEFVALYEAAAQSSGHQSSGH